MDGIAFMQFKAVRKDLETKLRHGQARKEVPQILVEEMLRYDIPIAARYEYVNVIGILQNNCLPFNPGLEALTRGLGILEKYGRNLLRPERPPLWRVVRLSNGIFKQQVDVIKGARDILKHLGYSKLIEDGLSYPDDILIPDIPVVTSVTTDILLLKLELMMLAHGEHKQENAFYSYIPAIEIKMVQEKNGVATVPNEEDINNAFPPMTPPTYQQVLDGAGKHVDLPLNNSKEVGVLQNGQHQTSSREIVDPGNYFENDEDLCDLCGQKVPVVKCIMPGCDGKMFCRDCSDIWHNHPKRRSHKDKLILSMQGAALNHPPMRTNESLHMQESMVRPKPPDLMSSLGALDTNNETEFMMRMNQKAIELMEIADPMRKQQRLEGCLQEINKEAEKYKKVVEKLQISTGGDSHLVQHLTSKLDEIEALKAQLKVICGVQDVQSPEIEQSSTTEIIYGAQSLSYPHIQQPSMPQPVDHSMPAEETPLIDLESSAATTVNSSKSRQLLEDMGLVLSNGPGGDMEDMPTDISQPKRQKSSIAATSTGNASIDSTEFKSTIGLPSFEEKPVDVRQVIQPSEFLSMFSPTELQQRIQKEELRFQTTQFLDYIRAGDGASFRPEQVEVALHELDKENRSNLSTPNSWLERNWSSVVTNFIQRAKEKGFRISPEDAEDVLLEADNVVEDAIALINNAQTEQIEDIAEHYGYDKARKALARHRGDKYHALASLQKESTMDMFREFQNSDEDADERLILRSALEIDNDPVRRKNAISAHLQISDGMYSETLTHLIQNIPKDLLDTLLEDAMDAIVENGMVHDVQAAIHYLDNECMICTEKFPRSKLTCLPTCGDNSCSYCLDCLQQHLTVCVNDKNIRDIVCPVCSKPEFGCDEETKTLFINHVDAILRNMPDNRVHEIFQQKLRDFTLMRLPNFRWCSHCSGGFQFDAINDNIKMLCPFCRKHTCYKCKKQWEPQHDGISCEQFQKWKEANDPEYQAAGLAQHLRENGIDCPDCNFRYALAKGGCMHFKCSQCSHEFCSGCRHAFKQGRQCSKLPTCFSKGLHAHHPRDCLFFLRDAEPEVLLKLLRDNGIQIDLKGARKKTCEVMEQKETPTGLKDAPCGRPVEQDYYAGLCKLHYMEYLVNLINTHGLDPADIFTADQLQACLLREGAAIPSRHRESDSAYRNKLLAEVKKLSLIDRTHDSRQ